MRSRTAVSLLCGLGLFLAPVLASHAAEARGEARPAARHTEVINASNFSFARTVLKSDVPVVVDFWAPWCVPCRALDGPLGNLADKLGSRARVVRVNVNWSPTLLHRYGVQSLPTLLVFKGGEVVARTSGGGTTAEELNALVSDALDPAPATGVQRAAVGQVPTADAAPILQAATNTTDGASGGGALR